MYASYTHVPLQIQFIKLSNNLWLPTDFKRYTQFYLYLTTVWCLITETQIRIYNKLLLKHFPLRLQSYAAIEPSDKMYFHLQNFPVNATFTLTTIKAIGTKVPLLSVYWEVQSISLQSCKYFHTQHINCTAQTILTLRTKHHRSHRDLNYHPHFFTLYGNQSCQRNTHNITFSWTDFKGCMTNKHLNKYVKNNFEIPYKAAGLSISQHYQNKSLLKHIL